MDDMIRELIAMDQRARDAMVANINRRDEARAKIAVEKSEIYDAYINRANRHITKMREQAEQNTADRHAALGEGFRGSAEKLEEQFRQNQNRWVEEVVNRCKQI